MKYLISLMLGIVTGGTIFAAGLVFNPFANDQSLSPLAVTDAQTISLAFSAASTDTIVFTNNGESRTKPHPEKVQQLWEAPIRKTQAMATPMRDGRNQTVGFGIKISSESESTRLLEGRAAVDSVWYVYLPGRGGLFIEQSENYWDFLRNVVLPAYRSSANTWKGTWLGNTTSGPGALGTSAVTGNSGDFAGLNMLGVESLSVKAWRVDGGSIAAEGRLLIELPAVIDIIDDVSDDSAVELD